MQLPQAAINAAYDSKYNRFIITPFYLTNHLVLMANIYAPSGNQKERDEFFKHFNTQLDSEIKKFATTIDTPIEVLVGGDWNTHFESGDKKS